MIPCSVPILTLNSIEKLQRFLPLFQERFDDVFIVDGNSTDGTKEYAQSLGVRVERQFDHDIPNSRIEDFKEMRLKSYYLAKYDWILYFDADELPGDSFIEAVAEAIKEVGAYSFQRRLVLPSGDVIRGDPWYGPSLRLFRRQDITFKDRKVHERMVLKEGIRLVERAEEVLCPDTPEGIERRSRGYIALEAASITDTSVRYLLRWIVWFNVRSLLGQFIRYFVHSSSPTPIPWSYAQVFLKYRIRAIYAGLRAWMKKR